MVKDVVSAVRALPPAGKPAITRPMMKRAATRPEAGSRPLQVTAGKISSPRASRPCRAANWYR